LHLTKYEARTFLGREGREAVAGLVLALLWPWGVSVAFFLYQPFSRGIFSVVLSFFLATITIVPLFLSVKASR
jgi:hypothetical protein